MTEPDGFWAIVAYEPAGAGTWGAGTDWTPYTYAPAEQITGLDAQSTVVQAEAAHYARSPVGGKVRAYWWDGSRWTLRPELSRDWGQLGLAGGAGEPPPPSLEAPAAPSTELLGPGFAEAMRTWETVAALGVAGVGAAVAFAVRQWRRRRR